MDRAAGGLGESSIEHANPRPEIACCARNKGVYPSRPHRLATQALDFRNPPGSDQQTLPPPTAAHGGHPRLRPILRQIGRPPGLPRREELQQQDPRFQRQLNVRGRHHPWNKEPLQNSRHPDHPWIQPGRQPTLGPRLHRPLSLFRREHRPRHHRPTSCCKGVGQRQRALTASNTPNGTIRCYVTSAVVRFAAD
jgi:hypothetical protein